MGRSGSEWCGRVLYGKAHHGRLGGEGRGAVGLGWIRLGLAGMARRGKAWSGGAGMERFASVGLVLVGFGRQGEVWLGADWKGKAGMERLGLARPGWAR